MRIKTQRIAAALLSLVLLLALAPAGRADGAGDTGGGDIPAVTESMPANGVDLTPGINTVNINLVPKDKAENEPTFATNIVNAKIQADLYLVAAAVKDEQYDTYHYEFVGDAPVVIADANVFQNSLADDPDPAKQNQYDTMLRTFSPLAQAFAKSIFTYEGLDTQKYPTKSVQAGTGTTIKVEGLDPGLYMLVLRGSDLVMDPADEEKCYVTTMTKAGGGQYNEYGSADTEIVVTRAFSDDDEFLFEPQMITVPTRVDDSGAQQYNTAYGTKWSNVLNIVAKPDWKPRYGDLKIVKTLQNYIGPDPATFVYLITATTGEGSKQKVVFSDVAGIHYPAETELIIEQQIPVGAAVTVEEVYAGSRYEAVGSITQNTVILSPNDAAAPANVTFTNTHNNTDFGGYGVVNHFTYVENKDDQSKSDWNYVKNDPMKSGESD